MPTQHTILQVLPAMESGGVERGTVEITQAIKEAGMIPLVASQGGAMEPHIRHAGGEHITLPLASKNPLTIYQNSMRLASLIRERKVSLVHARSRAPAWSAYWATQSARIPFVTTWHGVYGTEGPFKRRYNSVMSHADRIISVSKYVHEHVKREYGIEESKLRLIPRGVDIDVFSENAVVPQRIAELTTKWQLPDQPIPIILCPARITPIKGQDVLIDALAELKDLSFLCLFVGTDAGHEEYAEQLTKQIRVHGLEGKARLVGTTSYMVEAYMLSHLVVLPTIKPESFGRVSIEAQAMGRAIIATDLGGVRETLVNNETGYLVAPGNPKALAEALRFALLRSPEMVQAMQHYARQFVADNFSLALMQSKTIAVYQELLR